MQLDPPFLALNEAVAAATHRDLPEIEYTDRDWPAWKAMTKDAQIAAMKSRTEPTIKRSRRPDTSDIEVELWPQTWGSTALGYGGVGGAAMTPAYTVLVTMGNHYCVYFGGGRLAYRLDYSQMTPQGRERWRADHAARSLASVREVGRYA